MIVKIEWEKQEFEVKTTDGKLEKVVKDVPIPSVQHLDDPSDKWHKTITIGQLHLFSEVVKAATVENYTLLPSTMKDSEGVEVAVQDSVKIEIDDNTLEGKVVSTLHKSELYAFLVGTAEASMAEDISRMVIFGLIPVRAQFYNAEVFPKLISGITQSIVGILSGRVPSNKTRGGLIVPK